MNFEVDGFLRERVMMLGSAHPTNTRKAIWDRGYFVTVNWTGTPALAPPAVMVTVNMKLPSGVEWAAGGVVVFALVHPEKPQGAKARRNAVVPCPRGGARDVRDGNCAAGIARA